MDKIVDKIVALGVPGLVLLLAMATTGYVGAAALTAALATMGGPFGMLGGIAVLGLLVLISKGLANYGFEAIYTQVLKGLREKKGLSKKDITDKINSYPISRSMKRKLIEKMNSV
jgi:hypothetical protein